MTQVRDDVIKAGQLAMQCEEAVDDVTSYVTMTSRRLNDVTARAHDVSTVTHQKLSTISLSSIMAVSGHLYLTTSGNKMHHFAPLSSVFFTTISLPLIVTFTLLSSMRRQRCVEDCV